jgi:hypothetical protein
MIKKFIIVSVILFSVSKLALCQVGGISASKLATICADPVPNKVIEFEPSFGFAFSDKYFDNTSKLTSTFANSDSVELFSEFNFRLTYGVFENFEIGTTFPIDMSVISWGAKFLLNENDFFRTALMTGINLPIGNTILNKNDRHYDNTASYAAGIVSTLDISEKTGLDFDIQAQKLFNSTPENHYLDFFVNLDYSFWLTNEYQIIAGLNYTNNMFENYNEQLLTLNLGATIERHENFLLVVNSPIDLWGKNVQHIFGLGFALTISID